jgi:hypothetical protein
MRLHHWRGKNNSQEKYSTRRFRGKLQSFKSTCLAKRSYGFEVECINNIQEEKVQNLKFLVAEKVSYFYISL